MPRRVNPILLLGLIIAVVLSVAILASAKTGGGSASDALAAATGQVGMPYGYGTEGDGSFSCTGLVRHALRSAGVDPNAPWDHLAYLSAYPTRDTPVPGDVVVYPDGVAMYMGDNMVVMANDVDQVVGYYPMDLVGTPLGFANPYGGTLDPGLANPYGGTLDPTASDPAVLDQPALDQPALDQPALDQPVLDETVVDPALTDPAVPDSLVVDPALVDPVAVDPAAVDPMAF